MSPVHSAEVDASRGTLDLEYTYSAWAVWYAQATAFLLCGDTRLFKRGQKLAHPICTDYVGFTEEQSQAWLRNFRLLQRKNGECLSLSVSLYFII